MSSVDDARRHLAKAAEFLEAAELGLEMELFNAATSDAVISGINAVTWARRLRAGTRSVVGD